MAVYTNSYYAQARNKITASKMHGYYKGTCTKLTKAKVWQSNNQLPGHSVPIFLWLRKDTMGSWYYLNFILCKAENTQL